MTLDLSRSIFFTSYGGGHAAALAPVAAGLLRRGLPVRFLGLTTARRVLERWNLPCLGMVDLQPHVPGYRGVLRTGRLLAGEQGSHAVVPPQETEAYLGVGFHALVRQHGLPEARKRYERLGRQSFLPIDFFLALFSLHRPSVVVATSAPRSERAVFEAARRLGIPSVCVVDLYAPFEIEWCGSPGYASRICVLNPGVAARFAAHGVPVERVVPTGNPAFDRLKHLDRAALRRASRAERGLRDEDHLVVWISQPEPSIHPFSGIPGDPTLPLQVERHLASHFTNRGDVHLVMRLHPSEDRPPQVAGERIRYSNSSEPLDPLLCAADCVVTASSTVGLEAAMLNVPVVQCMDSIFSPDLPLAELGVAQAVVRHVEAGSCIDTILARKRDTVSHPSPSTLGPDAAELIMQQIVALGSFD